MESAAVLRSSSYVVSTSSHLKSVLERPGMITTNNSAFCNPSRLPVYGGKITSSTSRHSALLVSCVKTSETTVTAKSKGNSNGAFLSDSQQHGLSENKSSPSATLPRALLSEVCDETEIAELKFKIGAFEFHMKRKIDGPKSLHLLFPKQLHHQHQATKLAALEASGSSSYVIVSSPTVGSFRRARTLKGKKQPPACKEGDMIKEGQIVGFLDQFGTQLPVKKLLVMEIPSLLYCHHFMISNNSHLKAAVDIG
ncbi:UNVERIFIED_CONTAM: hypothetical protein Sradi_6259900 [Sesamum radiatum]|uniref:Uncharacterized protein n=1 Tax=Sesamum radiatum TaxID=300843 RepID=A0AAW2KBU9_SESRA